MSGEMKCNKGHKVQSWLINRGGTKIHRVHCAICKNITDFSGTFGAVKVTKLPYADNIDLLTGIVRDDDFWRSYGR